MNKKVLVALSAMNLIGMFGLTEEASAGVIQPTIATTASTSFTRTYTWEITKTASVSLLTLAPGESQEVYYTVQVVQIVTDSDWEVTGTIVIANPLESGVTLTDVSDSVSPGYAAAVQCPVSLPYGLDGGGSVTCTYVAALPDNASRTNTASFQYSGAVGTSGGGGSATADVIFGAPIVVGYPTVTVKDSYLGVLGQISDSATYTYSRTFIGGSDAPYTWVVSNTATILETGQSDSADVQIDVIGTVPEPGTLALLGLGLAGLGLSRRRKTH